MVLSRRDFGRGALAATSVAALAPATSWSAETKLPPGVSVINGVQMGLQPFCYHDLPNNEFNRGILIERMIQNRLGLVELHMTWAQPNFNTEGRTAQEAREMLRDWRLKAPADHYVKIRKQFADAGIRIGTSWVNYGETPDLEEVDSIYKAATLLGCKGVVGSYGLAVAQKVIPIAERYELYTGLHNHDNLSDPDALSNEASFVKGLAMSPKFRATLDVRHFTAGNGDAVDFLRKHHERTSAVHIGDRRRDNGHSVPFGQGDSPIIEVLQLIRDNKWPITCLLEFEHGTLRNGVQEVQIAYDYCKRALA
jgi:sugar phosphate isomerase/epimerase